LHEDHQRILNAVHRRDVEAARQAMLEHIEAVEELVVEPDTPGVRRRGRRQT